MSGFNDIQVSSVSRNIDIEPKWLIVNPSPDPVTINVTFDAPDGTVTIRSATVNGDATVESFIDLICGQEDGCLFPETISTFLSSDETQTFHPILYAEQARYFSYHLTVTDQDSRWTPPSRNPPVFNSLSAPENLINLNDSFNKLWTRLTRFPEDYLATQVTESTKGNNKSSHLRYRNLQVGVKRTLRVPNDGKLYPLPEHFGNLPLVNISQHKKSLPESFSDKSGFLVPLHNAEAMCLSFDGSSRVAMRVYTGGVNCISGVVSNGIKNLSNERPYQADPLPAEQDFIDTLQQKSLYGFLTGEKEVRQFVSTPLGKGTSIESQITGNDSVGGFQLEFIPSFDSGCEVIRGNSKIWPTSYHEQSSYNDCTTPSDLKLPLGTKFKITAGPKDRNTRAVYYTIADMQHLFNCSGSALNVKVGKHSRRLEGEIFIQRKGEKYRFDVTNSMTVGELKKNWRDIMWSKSIYERWPDDGDLQSVHLLRSCGIMSGSIINYDPPEPRGYHPGESSEIPCPFPEDYEAQWMGVGTGGKLMQKIYQNNDNRRIWDIEAATLVNIQILNSVNFAQVTGLNPPPSPIITADYSRNGFQWFEEYDGHSEVIAGTGWRGRRWDMVEIPLGSEDIEPLALGKDIYMMVEMVEFDTSHPLDDQKQKSSKIKRFCEYVRKIRNNPKI